MGLHVYAKASSGTWLPLLEALERALIGVPLHIYRSISDLLAELPGQGGGPPVVLVVGEDQELDELVGARERLAALRLVVVLPDAAPASRAKGHRLHPRVLFSQPVVPAEVAAVVAKMLGGPKGGGQPAR